ncbi:MAG: Shikimate dehydrogenase (NADP(+)) [Syntrophus sp. SKADARSKE-3]|nr:Shikimate dehydrogenase (NADP(+)) [Syntrophus sp. SKADARSKE-3]
MSEARQIFALFGNPVGHSLSPVMHRAALEQMNVSGDYVAFCVENLKTAVEAIRGLNIRGVSVTIPFKTAVLPLLDELDETARRIGAVNTIRNDGGCLTGFNTDAAGLINDLLEIMPLSGRSIAVLGAGGAARSIVFGAQREGADVIILNRTVENGKVLAREFGCSFYPISELSHVEADILINSTSVGMSPAVDRSPVDSHLLSRFATVVDVIYNPLQTKLLRDANAAGCRIRNGIGMFIHQGAEQIRLWTGQNPPVDLMRQVVLERLQSR